jgi:hypothetical protein
MSEQFGDPLDFSASFLCSLDWKILVRKGSLLQKAATFWLPPHVQF